MRLAEAAIRSSLISTTTRLQENEMDIMHRGFRVSLLTACCVAGFLAVTVEATAKEKIEWSGRNPVTAELSGDKELPPVSTQAYGRSTVKVGRDRSIAGTITVYNMKPTAAHVHRGGLNADGPVILPLAKTSETTFSVPPNTKLTEEQFARFREGNLYINVHSEQYPSGEIRAQMKP
jgi:hypothetical protein